MQSLPSPQDQRSPHHWTVDATSGLYFLDIIRQRKMAPVRGGGGHFKSAQEQGPIGGQKRSGH